MTVENLNSWGVFGAALGVLVVLAIAYHFALPPARVHGKKFLLIQVLYWVIAGATFAIPTDISAYIFSGLSVTVVGTVFPIYESLRAICTPDEDDDKYWLQYYMVGGIIFICTQAVDEWLEGDADVYWYQAMFYLYIWLYFPKTDGAALIYDHITEPCLSPRITPLTAKMTNCIQFLIQGAVNAIHIALVILLFMFFPDYLKKIIAVAVGTVYPWMCSITAAGTEQVEDDTYWLTYWVCYSCLFLIMELLENWIGWIPGFYLTYIIISVYLMLPMFQGAEKVFRKILVPLARLQDLLILRDAIQIKKRIMSELNPDQAEAVRKAIVEFYGGTATSDETGEGGAGSRSLNEKLLKKDLVSSWKSVRVQLPKIPNPFRRKKVKEDEKQEEKAEVTNDEEKQEEEEVANA